MKGYLPVVFGLFLTGVGLPNVSSAADDLPSCPESRANETAKTEAQAKIYEADLKIQNALIEDLGQIEKDQVDYDTGKLSDNEVEGRAIPGRLDITNLKSALANLKSLEDCIIR